MSSGRPAAVPPPAPIASPIDPNVVAAGDAERRRRAASKYGKTLMNGGEGLTAAPVTNAPKTLLGQ